ncbi:MAG: AraC family transcriptional regulator [Cytophagales bacterium]|jgi:AraC-like DNA-binding protein|nr:AraC family transcriptional regulator [Cytophagales bacterium]
MLAPAYRLINPQANRSFVYKDGPFDLTTRWHYHPEVELIFFTEGRANGVIGDAFTEFEAGELVLLGANFPHVLQENAAFAEQWPDVRPAGAILQFTEDFLGRDFLQRPETSLVRQLLDAARRGLRFRATAVAQVAPDLQAMPGLSDTRRLLALLQVLVTLAETDEYDFLTPQDYHFDHSRDEDRMRRVNQFVYEHFRDRITIAEVAAVANMTEAAFCRYFKTRTLKHFTRFLNEVRVAYACKLLQKPDCTVTDAAFESGFNSLSYFNRQFKTTMRMSPQSYRKRQQMLLK